MRKADVGRRTAAMCRKGHLANNCTHTEEVWLLWARSVSLVRSALGGGSDCGGGNRLELLGPTGQRVGEDPWLCEEGSKYGTYR